jgi:putative hemolysin
MIVLLIAAAFAAAFFFAGAETAFTSHNRLRIRAWAEGKGRRARLARTIEEYTEDPQNFLTTTLVGNNIAIVAVTALATYLLERHLGERSNSEAIMHVIDVAVVTPALLIFAEIIPKSIASHYPNRTSLWTIGPLRVAHWALHPVAWVVELLSDGVRRLLRLPTETPKPALRRADVVDLLSPQDDNGEVDEEEKIISGILEFRQATVKEALTPRTRVVGIDFDVSEEEILEVLSSGRFSRLPVYQGDIDHIIGVVHASDLLLASRKGPIQLRENLRPVPFVPEQKKAAHLLEELRSRREHLAVVLDEHGGTEGIVTLEDLLELLVGDIRDEHDVPDDLLRPVGKGVWMAHGQIAVDDLEDHIGLLLPDGNYETLAGYVIDSLGRIPIKGETLAVAGARIVVAKSDERSIQLLRIERPAARNG